MDQVIRNVFKEDDDGLGYESTLSAPEQRAFTMPFLGGCRILDDFHSYHSFPDVLWGDNVKL